jgi:hypothetical protein
VPLALVAKPVPVITPFTSKTVVGEDDPTPRRKFVLSQCKFAGVLTAEVPLPTTSLSVASVFTPVPPTPTPSVPVEMLVALV